MEKTKFESRLEAIIEIYNKYVDGGRQDKELFKNIVESIKRLAEMI